MLGCCHISRVISKLPYTNQYSCIYFIIRASSKCKVLDESFPAKFFEEDPAKIFDSYCNFVKSRSTAEGAIKNEEKLALTTISEQFENGEYTADRGGFYRLYHDIKLVCVILIHYYPQGTRNYQMVDKFYKFATELLLRECYKVGLSLVKVDIDVENDDKTELDKIIAKDFIKISTNYEVSLSQTYHIKTKDLELFSSTIAKSNLDNRPQELPNSNFEINKVIPQTNMCEEAPRLGFIAANTSNIPDPTLPPTEMMTRFLHPNWYALPTTVWLKYGEYKSWAPSFNENGTVVDSTTRGIIWLERIGYLEMFRKEEAVKMAGEGTRESPHEEAEVTEKTPAEGEKEQHEKISISNGKEEVTKENKDELIDDNHEVLPLNAQKGNEKETLSIKLENLFEWSPANYIDDDEIEDFREGKQDMLITKILLRIQKLRKERIAKKVTKPSIEETKLYNKARRSLKEVVIARQIPKLPMNHCRSFPVLQANYNGSIPVVRTQPSRKRKAKK